MARGQAEVRCRGGEAAQRAGIAGEKTILGQGRQALASSSWHAIEHNEHVSKQLHAARALGCGTLKFGLSLTVARLFRLAQ